MYEVIFLPKAEQQLESLEKNTQERIVSVLDRAKINPGRYFKKLAGESSYRLRVGNYRIIADILQDKLVILVLKVGHRKNVYKI